MSCVEWSWVDVISDWQNIMRKAAEGAILDFVERDPVIDHQKEIAYNEWLTCTIQHQPLINLMWLGKKDEFTIEQSGLLRNYLLDFTYLVIIL